MVLILMMSVILPNLTLPKIKVFWYKCFNVIIYVYDITNKILPRDSNNIVGVAIRQKFDTTSIYMSEVIITLIVRFE